MSRVFQECFNEVLFCNFIVAWISSQLPEQKEGLFTCEHVVSQLGKVSKHPEGDPVFFLGGRSILLVFSGGTGHFWKVFGVIIKFF